MSVLPPKGQSTSCNSLPEAPYSRGQREIFEKREPQTISVTYSNINGLLGTHISHEAVTRALRSIDLHIKKEDENGLLVAIPHFRHDINEPADIIEEISRIHGFEHIPATRPFTVLIRRSKQKRNAP